MVCLKIEDTILKFVRCLEERQMVGGCGLMLIILVSVCRLTTLQLDIICMSPNPPSLSRTNQTTMKFSTSIPTKTESSDRRKSNP